MPNYANTTGGRVDRDPANPWLVPLLVANDPIEQGDQPPHFPHGKDDALGDTVAMEQRLQLP